MHNFDIFGNKVSLSSLPSGALIYFLLREGSVVYVGKTTKGIQRILAHIEDKEFDSYAFFNCPEYLLNETENFYILKHCPEYNARITLGGKYGNWQQVKELTGLKAWPLKSLLRRNNIKEENFGKIYDLEKIKEALKKEGRHCND